MRKHAKIVALCASLALAIACLAGCGGTTSSAPSKAKVQLVDEEVAGIEMKVPADMGDFMYNSTGSIYIAQSNNNYSAIIVSELMEVEDETLADLGKTFIESTLMSDYTDIKWSSFETNVNQAPSVNYNYGTCTAKASTGGDLNLEIKFYMYEDIAAQFVMTMYSPGKGAELEDCAAEVMKSLNPDNDTMAEYLVAWAVYKVAGLNTAQLSEPDNLAAANKLIEQAMAS